MNRINRIAVIVFGLLLATSGVCLGQQASDDYGQAVVENVLRVNSQCWIFCDIRDWPAIVGKEIPVQIRGLDPQTTAGGFDLPTRQFILETLTHALAATPAAADPNKAATPQILLTHIQRSEAFCLIADVQVDGRDLAALLVDKGYAKRLIIPKNAAAPATPDTTEPATQPQTPPDAENGFIASKSGKVFHKPTCPHAKRIQDGKMVRYSTRQQAIDAGRRSCQTCNP